MARFTIQKPCLLLGEGKDEVEFFGALLHEMGLADSVQVLDYSGISKLPDFLIELSLLGIQNVRTIAVTRDADEDAASALTSLKHVIDSSPLAPLVKDRLFVLPNNQSPGALEALWLASMKDSPFTPCVDDFFRCIESRGWKPSQTFAKNDKARAQLFIATKDTPNERFGTAAWHGRKDTDKPWMVEKWFDFDHPAFEELKHFLRQAFAPAVD
jgi:hypothetical protein